MYRNLVHQTLLYGGGDLFGRFIAFMTFPFVAAALSPRAFGVLDLIATSVALMGLLIGCGLNNAVQRFYWDTDATRPQQAAMVSTGFAVQFIFGLIIILAGLLLMPVILPVIRARDLPLGFVSIVAALLLTVATQLVQYIQDVTRLHFSPRNFLFLSVLIRIAGAGLSVLAVVYLKGGIDGYLMAQAAVMVIAVPIGLWLIRKDVVPTFDRTWARELVHLGHPFIFAGLAYWLFGSMDRWMLASMSSVEETGVYSVAFRFATIVLFVSMAFGKAWSPHAVKIRTDHPEKYREIYGVIFLFLVYAMLVAGGGTALFADEILKLTMPAAYAGAAMPLAILCFGIILQSTQQVTALGISLEKKTYLLAHAAWITAALNFVGNLILVPLYGATGSAIATSLSYLVLTGLYLYFTQRLHPIHVYWGRLGCLTVLGIAVGVMAILARNPGLSLSLVALKLAVAVICMVLGALALPFKDLKHVV